MILVHDMIAYTDLIEFVCAQNLRNPKNKTSGRMKYLNGTAETVYGQLWLKGVATYLKHTC